MKEQDQMCESQSKSGTAGIGGGGSTPETHSAFLWFDKALQKEIAQFFKDTEIHLQRIHSDFLSDAARKDQRLLLAIAFLLLFVSLGSLAVSGTEIKAPGEVKLTLAAPENFMKLGFFVCLYFEVIYAIRCYIEWTAHSLASSLAEQELHIVQIDTIRRVRPFSETREGLRAAGSDGWGPLNSSPQSEEEIQSYNNQKTQHERAMVVLEAKKEWIRKHLSTIRLSTFLRMAFEVVGPLVFGAYALVTAYRVLGW